MSSVYGQIVTGGQVEAAMETTLKRWIPTYLREVERQTGATQQAQIPRSYVRDVDVSKWPEQQLPAIITVAGGIDANPEPHPGYLAWWDIRVAVVVHASGADAARRLAHLHSAAIRAAIIQNQSLGGFATSTRWVSEVYEAALPEGTKRALAAGVVGFKVAVSDTVFAIGGPAVPDPNPPAVPVADVVSILVDALS